MTATTHIYSLTDPRDGEIRYIGKADDLEYRYRCHLNDRSHNAKSRWVGGLMKHGLYPQMRCVATIPMYRWQEAEEFFIALHKAAGCRLLNLTVGGEGMNGGTHTEATRRVLSEKAKQRGVSAEHLAYMTARAAECNRGKPRPCDNRIRQKISSSLMGHTQGTEQRQKKSASLKSFYQTPEGKVSLARQTEEKKRRVVKPEQWMAAVAANKGKPHTTEHRAKLREAWVRRKQRMMAGVN